MRKVIDIILEENICLIERKQVESIQMPPSEIKALQIATYKAVKDILVNALGQPNEERKYQAMDRMGEHLRIMREKIDRLNGFYTERFGVMKPDYENPRDGDDYGKIKI